MPRYNWVALHSVPSFSLGSNAAIPNLGDYPGNFDELPKPMPKRQMLRCYDSLQRVSGENFTEDLSRANPVLWRADSDDGACTNWAEEFLAVYAAPRSGTITVSRALICSAMRKGCHGAKITAAPRMAIRWPGLPDWQ